MSDTTYKIWYFIDGTYDASSVSVSLDETIVDLKKKIHSDAPNCLAGCYATFLVLTKVRYIMVFMDTDVINALYLPITPVGRCRPC